jgi:hypothetical protein
MAVGIMSSTGAQKPAYAAFKIMDTGDTNYLVPSLGLGKTSWAELGLN